MTEGKVTRIALEGKLDAARAPELMAQLNTLIGKDIEKIIFACEELTYISSAGVRTLIFAKQKIGDNVTICMENANEMVKDVIDMSGLVDYIEFTDA